MATDNKNDDFEQSFNEGPPAAAEVSEDQAFGITPPEDGGSSETGEPAAVVIVADEVVAGEGGDAASDEAAAAEAKAVTDENNAKASASAGAESTATQEAAGSGAAQPAASPDGEAVVADAPHGEMPAGGDENLDLDDMSDVPAEDVQKFKSWQGRLKKIEADLKAKATSAGATGQAAVEAEEDTTVTALEQVANETPNASLADAASEVADQVAAGEITSEQATKMLAEDFGEDFVRMIEAIARATAGKTADEKIGGVSKNVEDVISHITNQSERAHFEAIYDAHPDFVEVNANPAFQEFVAAKGAQETVEKGSAKAINALLAEFKSSGEVDSGDTAGGETVVDAAASEPVTEEVSPAQDAVAAAEEAVDDGSDDAEGVRSAGLRLPADPKTGSDDFAAAWDEFA